MQPGPEACVLCPGGAQESPWGTDPVEVECQPSPGPLALSETCALTQMQGAGGVAQCEDPDTHQYTPPLGVTGSCLEGGADTCAALAPLPSPEAKQTSPDQVSLPV